MVDRKDIDVDETCARLRKLLAETRGLSRREFAKALGQALAGSAFLSVFPRMSPQAAAAEPPVTAFVFGGVWKKSAMTAFGEPFTKKTGIPVVYQDPYTFAKLRAMHEAKAMQVDVVSVQGGEMFQAKRMNMLTPLDFSVIDRWPNDNSATAMPSARTRCPTSSATTRRNGRVSITPNPGRISGTCKSFPAAAFCGARRSG